MFYLCRFCRFADGKGRSICRLPAAKETTGKMPCLTTIGPISLNFDESSCLETDQIPQNFRQSLRSLPDESHLPPPESQSSMMKKNVVPEKNKQ